MIVGTAALLAVAAVLALAVGAILRRSAAAVTVVIVVIVLPYLLASPLAVLPAGAADWLLRVTPAAALRRPAGHPGLPAGHGRRTRRATATSRWRPGPGSPCCAPGPRSPWPWPVPAAPEGRVRQALHAEWTKLRTLAGTGWLLLAAVALTVAVSAAAAAAIRCPSGAGCQVDPAKVSLTGIDLGQAVVAILAVLAISGEYSTGMIRVTLAAMPRRTAVLAAKAAVLTGLVLAAGTVAVLGSLLAGRLILPGHGFDPAHGYPALSLGRRAGAARRRRVGPVPGADRPAQPRRRHRGAGLRGGHRDRARAALPVPDHRCAWSATPAWHRHLEQIGPMTAGLAIQATTGLRSLPISPWAGLGVLAAWAAAALLAGGLLLGLRDA